MCADWTWLEPQPLLPVREHLQRRPWSLQFPPNDPEAHALVFCARSRGYRDDNVFPVITTDVPLEFAEWLPWAGQA